MTAGSLNPLQIPTSPLLLTPSTPSGPANVVAAPKMIALDKAHFDKFPWMMVAARVALIVGSALMVLGSLMMAGIPQGFFILGCCLLTGGLILGGIGYFYDEKYEKLNATQQPLHKLFNNIKPEDQFICSIPQSPRNFPSNARAQAAAQRKEPKLSPKKIKTKEELDVEFSKKIADMENFFNDARFKSRLDINHRSQQYESAVSKFPRHV